MPDSQSFTEWLNAQNKLNHTPASQSYIPEAGVVPPEDIACIVSPDAGPTQGAPPWLNGSFAQESNGFPALVKTWISEQIQSCKNLIEQRKADYQRKNWKWSEDATKDFNTRIDELNALSNRLDTEFFLGKSQLGDVLTLANIVYNEAGIANQKAKAAIAYAWLNRAGVMREVRKNENGRYVEISHYQPLLKRWEKLDDLKRLLFLRDYSASLTAARQRLFDNTPAEHDPTQGATHWVSPIGLDPFNGQKDRYSRTVGRARNRAFPLWARSPDDPMAAKMKKAGKLGENHAELSVSGVDKADFLFYIGVK